MDISPGEIATHRDFSERLNLQFNNQAQFEYYSGGATISLEGVLVKCFKPLQEDSCKEFYTYLSDGKQQDSAVVFNHMEKLILVLKEKGIMKDGQVAGWGATK